jgi:hypothetical protein
MTLRAMRWAPLVGLAAIVLVVTGCAQTLRARSVERTGFMGADYALLKPGTDRQAQLRYVRPNVDWARYRNILLDPITVWDTKQSSGQGVSAADKQALVDYFYAVIQNALRTQGFKLVDSPQPDTLRVKVAITKAEQSNVTLDVISTVVPQAVAASALDQLMTGKPAFVGEAQLEVKVNDAVSGELLAAGIDHRVGGKTLDASTMQSWGDVEAMMRLWAGHGSYNLCRMEHRTDCVAPPGSKPAQSG